MNREVRDDWLARLRSGRYRQGRELLCRIDRWDRRVYCCLGVLCECAVDAGIVRRELRDRPGGAGRAVLYVPVSGRGLASLTSLPLVVRHWAEVDELVLRVGPRSLIELNDDDRADFATIADLIEEEL